MLFLPIADITHIRQQIVTEFEFNNTHCFKIKVPNIGSAAAIYYDIAALNMCCQYIEKEHITDSINHL